MASTSAYTIRRAVQDDAETINEILASSPATASLFASSPNSVTAVENLLERSILSLVVVNTSTREIVGFASASDNLSGVDGDQILAQLYETVSDAVVSPGNSLFLATLGVHLSATSQAKEITIALLRGIFAGSTDTDHLVLLKNATSAQFPAFMQSSFVKVPIDVSGATIAAKAVSAVYLCPRQKFVPTLYVRNARVEDHDDLAPVFSEVEPARFGEFFLAEVIERQGGSQRVLVGEGPEGRAVGLMAFSTEVPFEVVNACFETNAYGHLSKRSALLRARDARAATLASRSIHDWFTVLSSHGEELQGVFDAIPSATHVPGFLSSSSPSSSASSSAAAAALDTDFLTSPLSPDTNVSGAANEGFAPNTTSSRGEDTATGISEMGYENSSSTPLATASSAVTDSIEEQVLIADIAAVFDAKGDTWGYIGVGGSKLGHAMLVDVGIVPAASTSGVTATIEPFATVTRSSLNAEVAAFADRRDAVHRRMRVSAWYMGQKSKDEAEEEESKEEEVVAPAAAAATTTKPGAAPATATAGTAAAAKPGAAPAAPAAPVVAAASAAPTSAGPLPGRKMLNEEMDKLVASIDQGRKERLRAAQQAVVATQKEADAIAAAERAALEAAAKEAHDKAEAEAAGMGHAGHPSAVASAVPTGTFGTSFMNAAASKRPGRRASTQNMEARLEKVTHAAQAAQLELLQPLRVPFTTLAAAVNKRLAIEESGASSSTTSTTTPGDDLVAELLAFYAEALATAPVPPGSSSSSHTHHEPSPPTAITKPVFTTALDLWEKRSMPRAASPVIVITSSAAAKRYTFALTKASEGAEGAGAAASPPQLSPAEAAMAEGTASLLHIPLLHVPALLTQLAGEYAAAEAALAALIEKLRIDEEKRKKKEEDDAKKALAGGTVKKDKKKDKKDEAPKEPPTNSLIDPSKNPLGAMMQYLQSHASQFTAGFVLSGVPAHDSESCGAIATALTHANYPPVLNIHVEEGSGPGIRPRSAPGSARRRASVNASDRLFASARHRRDSVTPRVAEAATSSSSRHVSSPLTTHTGHGLFGSLVRIEGQAARLEDAHNTHSAGDEPQWNKITREVLIATLLREGVLRTDPTDTDPTLSSPMTAAQLEVESKKGEPNAFLISLFCLAKANETRYLDLLAGAFEAFPDREYALLMLPYGSGDMPLLKRFVQVSPTSNSTLNQTLYVCHRDSLLAPALATVRRATVQDRPAIAALVGNVSDRSTFMDAVVAAERRLHLPVLDLLATTPCARVGAFVTEVEGQIVGACVLSACGASPNAVEASRQSFALDAFMEPGQYYNTHEAILGGGASSAAAASTDISTKVCSLLHVCFNPIFLSSATSSLRQAARQFGGRSALLYRQPSSAVGAHLDSPLPPVIRTGFNLVRPRQMPELTTSERAAREADHTEAAETDAFSSAAAASIAASNAADGVSYAAHTVVGMTDRELSDPRSLDHVLYVLTSKTSLLPRSTLNTRVVIVGASDAALSAIASLLLHPTIALPHITLVAPGGLPSARDAFTSPAPFTPGREFSAFELARMPIASQVRIVDDVVIRINRKERTVGLAASRSILRYDRLLLLPGLTEATWGRLGFESPDALPLGMHCLANADAIGPLTADVDTLANDANNASSAAAAKSSSSRNSVSGNGDDAEVDDPSQVVVYGDTLDALTAISGLLDRGIPGPKVLHVRPGKAGPDQSVLAVAAAIGAGAVDGSGGSGDMSSAASGVATDDGAAAAARGDITGSGAGALAATASIASLDSALEEKAQLLESLLPTPPAPLSEAALFPARAVAAMLDQAGVRQIVGAELLGVEGQAKTGDMRVDADGAPIVYIPGLTLNMRVRVRAPPVIAGSSSGTDDEEKKDDFEPSLSMASDSKEGESSIPVAPATSEVIKFRSALLICCDTRDVDPRFFKAVNDCGIVYDGRLVVDHRFIATDPAVFGGGSVAKFSRRYRAPLPLQRYDSREVGAAVANAVIADIENGGGAAAAGGAASSVSLASLLPRFSRPKSTKALLPGGLHFVASRLPEYDLGGTGREIATHIDAKRGQNGLRHCRLLLSRFGRVADISYCGTDDIEASNLCNIVGQSGFYLNGLERRMDAGDLPDLISFLRGGWASALYHDRIGGLLSALRNALKGDAQIAALADAAEAVLRAAAEGEEAAPAVVALRGKGIGVAGNALSEDTRRSIEKRVLAFLAANQKILPSYLIPAVGMV